MAGSGSGEGGAAEGCGLGMLGGGVEKGLYC